MPLDVPMQPVSKQVRDFVRAADLLLQQINEKGHFNDFEKVLLTSAATRLNSANTLLEVHRDTTGSTGVVSTR